MLAPLQLIFKWVLLSLGTRILCQFGKIILMFKGTFVHGAWMFFSFYKCVWHFVWNSFSLQFEAFIAHKLKTHWKILVRCVIFPVKNSISIPISTLFRFPKIMGWRKHFVMWSEDILPKKTKRKQALPYVSNHLWVLLITLWPDNQSFIL